MKFQEFNGDQRREAVNTRQRYAAWREARTEVERYKGSMVWTEDRGTEYLVRSAYSPKTGLRRQKSLGPRSPKTERLKTEYERARAAAKERLAELEQVLERQVAINRAVGLGRVPLLGARIIRSLDAAGLLGRGIRIVGTNAIYAYEAVSGVFVEAVLTTTEDIDLLLDARREIRFAAIEDVSEQSLMAILRKVDHSFKRSKATFRASNRDGYFVDLIRPMPSPPWKNQPKRIGNVDDEDLMAVDVEGLHWLADAPAFEAVAIDEHGGSLTISAPDPRVFAIHKWWLSQRLERDALKRRRDAEQARAVAQLVVRYLQHLPYDHGEIPTIPRQAFDDAKHLFAADPARGDALP